MIKHDAIYYCSKEMNIYNIIMNLKVEKSRWNCEEVKRDQQHNKIDFQKSIHLAYVVKNQHQSCLRNDKEKP